MNNDPQDIPEHAAASAAARPRLLATVAAMLDALYDQAAVPVLATLKPADMRPGGARVPGTSYELDAATAATAMRGLLAVRGAEADALLAALAEHDVRARYAMLAGQSPPTVEVLYEHCMGGVTVPGSGNLEAALEALMLAAGRIFTPAQSLRITSLAQQWQQQPERLDTVPVQQFIATFVRNSP